MLQLLRIRWKLYLAITTLAVVIYLLWPRGIPDERLMLVKVGMNIEEVRNLLGNERVDFKIVLDAKRGFKWIWTRKTAGYFPPVYEADVTNDYVPIDSEEGTLGLHWQSQSRLLFAIFRNEKVVWSIIHPVSKYDGDGYWAGLKAWWAENKPW